jgi:beta-phosphoglucomutase-like phosphatase (HAD superfamily)
VLFYDDEKIGAIKPCPHVAETLPALRDRGLKPGVVTDAHNRNALKWLRKAGIKRIF